MKNLVTSLGGIRRWVLILSFVVGGMVVLAVQSAEAQLYGNPIETPATGAEGYGWSVAIDGKTMAVGAPFDSAAGKYAGAVYVYNLSRDAWVMNRAPLTAGGANANFGITVAIDGDTMVVGATEQSKNYKVTPPTGNGMAFLYKRSGTHWQQQKRLAAPGGRIADLFGSSVAIDGDHVIIGATGVGPRQTCCVDHGAVYAFGRDGAFKQKLDLPPDGTRTIFGSNLAIDGEYLVVGERWHGFPEASFGAAYVYRYLGDKWHYQTKLDAPGTDFGIVAIAGDTIAVGATRGADLRGGAAGPYRPAKGVDTGRVYVFERSGTSWPLQQQLPGPDDLTNGDFFGAAVAMRGDVLIVGAYRHDGDVEDGGVAYLYNRPDDAWTLATELSAVDLGPGACFGGAIATDGSTAVISNEVFQAFGWQTSESGRAYYFSDLLNTVEVEIE